MELKAASLALLSVPGLTAINIGKVHKFITMAINKLSVFEAGFLEDAALMEASFFENLHRCRVIIVNMGMDSYRIGIAKIIFYGLFDT